MASCDQKVCERPSILPAGTSYQIVRTAGFAAEISALLQERCFTSLEAPVLRITGWDTPFPYTLENDYLPLAPRILKGLRGLAAYQP